MITDRLDLDWLLDRLAGWLVGIYIYILYIYIFTRNRLPQKTRQNFLFICGITNSFDDLYSGSKLLLRHRSYIYYNNDITLGIKTSLQMAPSQFSELPWWHTLYQRKNATIDTVISIVMFGHVLADLYVTNCLINKYVLFFHLKPSTVPLDNQLHRILWLPKYGLMVHAKP